MSSKKATYIMNIIRWFQFFQEPQNGLQALEDLQCLNAILKSDQKVKYLINNNFNYHVQPFDFLMEEARKLYFGSVQIPEDLKRNMIDIESTLGLSDDGQRCRPYILYLAETIQVIIHKIKYSSIFFIQFAFYLPP